MTTQTEIHKAIRELTRNLKEAQSGNVIAIAKSIKLLCESLETLELLPDEDAMPIPVDPSSAKRGSEDYLKNPQEVSIDNPFGVGPNE